MKISFKWYISTGLLNAFLNWVIFFNLGLSEPYLIVGLITLIILAIILYVDKLSSIQNKIIKSVIYLFLAIVLPAVGFYIFLKWIFSKGSWAIKGV